jgi:hypothetical protein
MLGGFMQLRHGGRYGARHARADDERDQFDDGEENRHEQQNVFHAANELSQRCEQMSV